MSFQFSISVLKTAISILRTEMFGNTHFQIVKLFNYHYSICIFHNEKLRNISFLIYGIRIGKQDPTTVVLTVILIVIPTIAEWNNWKYMFLIFSIFNFQFSICLLLNEISESIMIVNFKSSVFNFHFAFNKLRNWQTSWF